MRDSANVTAVAALRPDYLGFIFYPKSKRYFLDAAKPADLSLLPSSIQKVGVFVDENPEKVLEISKKYKLNILQLHGNESPETCAYFKTQGFGVWKALAVEHSIPQEYLHKYTGSVDCFLLDTKTPQHGGSGLPFDWSILKTYPSDTPFMLAGGISLDNIAQAKKYLDGLPAMGLDLNSKFETEPGIKNVLSLKQAFEIIRK